MNGPFNRQAAVAEGARSTLLRNPYLALRNIDCDFRDGVLTLRGCVPSYHLKQMAQAAVGALEGVTLVVNQIEVLPRAARDPGPPSVGPLGGG